MPRDRQTPEATGSHRQDRTFCSNSLAGPSLLVKTERSTPEGVTRQPVENNETGKDLLGLTQYQVRSWTGRHRHITTVMLALAFLAITRAQAARPIGIPYGSC